MSLVPCGSPSHPTGIGTTPSSGIGSIPSCPTVLSFLVRVFRGVTVELLEYCSNMHRCLQSERLAIKVIKSLRMSDKQTTDLAQMWHTWRRRRATLDSKLAAVASVLDNLLPDQVDVELGLLSAILNLPEPSDSITVPTPVDTIPPTASAFTHQREASTLDTVARGAVRGGSVRSFPIITSAKDSLLDDSADESLSDYDSEDTYQPAYGIFNKPSLQSLNTEHTTHRNACEGEHVHVHSSSAQSERDALKSEYTSADQKTAPHANSYVEVDVSAAGIRVAKQERHKKNALLLQLVELASGIEHNVPQAFPMHTREATKQQAVGPKAPHGVAPSPQPLRGSADSLTIQHSIPSRAELAQHIKEGSSPRGKGKGRRLLGESGSDMHALEDVISELLRCIHSDLLLINQSTQHSFGLTPVRCSSSPHKSKALVLNVFHACFATKASHRNGPKRSSS